MLLVDEPGTRRLFVNDMRGPIYSVSYDGKTVTPYVDINVPDWNVGVQSAGRERGMQSFAFHPQFGQRGAPGYGKFYTLTDTTNTKVTPDFTPGGGSRTHDTVLLEWTAKDAAAPRYDGGAPRELIRWEQPFANHNAGQLGFNPTAKPGTIEAGLLYIGFADGGSGGDPLELSQNLGSSFGKILRIDPLGSNSRNKKYGIPADNPFVKDANPNTLDEIYAYGVRNPQRFAWDPRNGNLFLADIGQNIVEEVSLITSGANLGWNDWEGSYRFISRSEVGLDQPRGDAKMSYPVVEYRTGRSASAGIVGGDDGLRIPADRDQAAGQQGRVRRQPERRDLLLRRRQPAEGRPGRDPPGAAQRRRHVQDAAADHPRHQHQAGQDARYSRRPALRSGSRRPDFSVEQGGRCDSCADPVTHGAAFVGTEVTDEHGAAEQRSTHGETRWGRDRPA